MITTADADSLVQDQETEIILTNEERQVVTLVARGLSDANIAQNMRITLPGVRRSIKGLSKKLEVSDRLGLVIYAFANDMMGPMEG